MIMSCFGIFINNYRFALAPGLQTAKVDRSARTPTITRTHNEVIRAVVCFFHEAVLTLFEWLGLTVGYFERVAATLLKLSLTRGCKKVRNFSQFNLSSRIQLVPSVDVVLILETPDHQVHLFFIFRQTSFEVIAGLLNFPAVIESEFKLVLLTFVEEFYSKQHLIPFHVCIGEFVIYPDSGLVGGVVAVDEEKLIKQVVGKIFHTNQ